MTVKTIILPHPLLKEASATRHSSWHKLCTYHEAQYSKPLVRVPHVTLTCLTTEKCVIIFLPYTAIKTIQCWVYTDT